MPAEIIAILIFVVVFVVGYVSVLISDAMFLRRNKWKK